MAILEDKKKPYDIYAPGTPTVRAQDKNVAAVKSVTAPVVNSARDFSGKMLGGNAIAAGLTTVEKGREGQKAFLATEANKRARAALGLKYPQGRQVDANSPMSNFKNPIQAEKPKPTGQRANISQLGALQPGEGSITISGTGETVSLRGGRVVKTDANGFGINNLSRKLSNESAAPARNNGTMRAGVGGTMDVTFDESTSLSARKAFMDNPVKPVGQMAMYDRREQAWSDQVAAKNAQLDAAQAMPQQLKLYTPENSPGMGHRERIALNEQVMASHRQQQADIAAMAREKLKGTFDMGSERLRSETTLGATKLSGENQLANTRQTIEAEAPLRAAQTESYKADNTTKAQLAKQNEMKAKLLEEANDSTKTEAERKAANDKLYALGLTDKKGFDKKGIYDEEGMKVGEEIFSKDTGLPIEAQQQNVAPQSALDFLKKNPKEAENFKRKYGYLPEGY